MPFLLLLLFSASAHSLTFHGADEEVESFFYKDAHWARELALEPSKHNAFRLLQVSDGRSLISQVFAADGRLADCDVIESESAVQDFIAQFNASTGGKAIDESPAESSILNIQRLRKQCHRWQSHAMGKLRREQRLAESAESEPERRSQRQKRSFMIYPGTNWCGKGNQARFVSDFGSNAGTDRCCLEHDACPYIIEGFQSAFHYFNYRFHTLSYCDCDNKFRECLKAANDGAANIVGKVYFNVVSTQCFDLRRERVCSKRSWWGSCSKETMKLVAQVQDQVSY